MNYLVLHSFHLKMKEYKGLLLVLIIFQEDLKL